MPRLLLSVLCSLFLLGPRFAAAGDAGTALPGAADLPRAADAGVEGPSQAAAREVLLGSKAALAGDRVGARRALEHAMALAPQVAEIAPVSGLAALLTGDLLKAREQLSDRPGFELYLAMAEADGPGGLSRAKETLARAARGPKADAAVLFLASLAFSAAGDDTLSDEILARAVARAHGALDEAFAPDPAVGLASAAVAAIHRLDPEEAPALPLAHALVAAKRVPAGARLAEAVLEGREKGTTTAARRLLVEALAKIDPRRALDQADLLLKEEPGDEATAITRVQLLLRWGDRPQAQVAIRAIGSAVGPKRAVLLYLRSDLLLDEGQNPAEALRLAEAATEADPESNPARAVLCRALVAQRSLDRALAFGNDLLRRKPRDVDAYEVLRRVREAAGDRGQAEQLAIQSRAFRGEQAKISGAAERLEHVIRAVRGADAGLGPVGMEALRAEEPFLSLPIDLTLAQKGKKGTQHVARDRIRAACTPELVHFLRNRASWSVHPVEVSLYGDPQSVSVLLSAADPGRCSHPPDRTRTLQRSR